MSTTPKSNSVPYAPSLKELQEHYKHYNNPHLIKRTYQQVKKTIKLSIAQPRCLTQIQFVEFMRVLGLPNKCKQSDFPFLEGIKIY